jgi:hypothetical protein
MAFVQYIKRTASSYNVKHQDSFFKVAFEVNYWPFWNIFTHCGGHTFSHAIQKMQSFSLIMKGFFSDAGCPGVSSHS